MTKEEMPEQSVEKRKHERKPTNIKIEVVTGGKLSKETAKDISFGGIYINNRDFEKYEIDEDIVLAFESKSGEAHTLEGKIVRKDKEGIGIRFKKELIAIALKHAEEWL
ncbi:MAG: PilZ domain-containing protein [Desulfobacula sp.]|nr:PilZ domain-containing protein [Desulfobacula sp.]